jgi:hypothetical protein
MIDRMPWSLVPWHLHAINRWLLKNRTGFTCYFSCNGEHGAVLCFDDTKSVVSIRRQPSSPKDNAP